MPGTTRRKSLKPIKKTQSKKKPKPLTQEDVDRRKRKNKEALDDIRRPRITPKPKKKPKNGLKPGQRIA